MAFATYWMARFAGVTGLVDPITFIVVLSGLPPGQFMLSFHSAAGLSPKLAIPLAGASTYAPFGTLMTTCCALLVLDCKSDPEALVIEISPPRLSISPD